MVLFRVGVSRDEYGSNSKSSMTVTVVKDVSD